MVVEGVEGHPGALVAGWADGASARVSLPRPIPGAGFLGGGYGHPAAGGLLLDLLGRDLVISVARLAEGVHRRLGDDMVEWAVHDGQVWLFQSGPGRPVLAPAGHGADPGYGPGPRAGPGLDSRPGLAPASLDAECGAGAPGPHLAAREWMPLLGMAVQEHGRHLRGRPAAAG